MRDLQEVFHEFFYLFTLWKITCFSRHVHSNCDPDANERSFLEKRASQFNYVYECKVCKGLAQKATVHGTATTPTPTSGGSFGMTSPRDSFDKDSPGGETRSFGFGGSRLLEREDSFDDSKDGTSMGALGGSIGLGRGKPMAFPGKRNRLGKVGRPPGSTSASGYAAAAAAAALNKPDYSSSSSSSSNAMKRVAECRRRGRQPKIRGMVGLERPQAETGMKEEPEEGSKMICVSVDDKFVMEQDICVMCGSIGTDLEGRLIACVQCGECYHPHCTNTRVSKVILQKGWRCLDCTVCEGCGLKHDEANIILCDDCDISYHIYCVQPPLDTVPTGAWKCKWCAVCHMCGTSDPGVNSQWHDNYSLCGPCQSLQKCTICEAEDGYEEGEMIIRCTTCKRWCHAECDSITNEDEAEKCSEDGYVGRCCRPPDVLPPHLAKPALGGHGSGSSSSLGMSGSSDMYHHSAYGHYSNASFMVDGVILSERGMTMLKSQTVERERQRRKRRGMNIEDTPSSSNIDPSLGSNDNSLEGGEDNDDDDDLMPPPTPGGAGGSHKDGDIVRPLPDGRPPDAPDGFTVVQKDNGIMVLRKRRYRDLKKVGIGGFMAKTRTPSRKPKDDEPGPDGEKPKKRPAWRPKKNKLLVQYPEYIQDAFFGKDIMESLDSTKNPEDFLDETPTPGDDKNHGQNRGLRLSKDILAALEEVRVKEEKERKEKEDAEARAKAAAHVPDDIKPGDVVAGGGDKKEDGMGEDLGDDDLLPSDLFGDDIFKIMDDPSAAGGLEDIDDSALDDAEKEDKANADAESSNKDSKANNELADALRDTFGPGIKLDSKDMEDIFNDIVDDETKPGDGASNQAKAGEASAAPGSGPVGGVIKSEPQSAQQSPVQSQQQGQQQKQQLQQPQQPQQAQPQQQQQSGPMPPISTVMSTSSPMAVSSPPVGTPTSATFQPQQQPQPMMAQQGGPPMQNMTTIPSMMNQGQRLMSPPHQQPQQLQQPHMMQQQQQQQQQLQLQRQNQMMHQQRAQMGPQGPQATMNPVMQQIRPGFPNQNNPQQQQPPMGAQFAPGSGAPPAPSPYHQPEYATPAALQQQGPPQPGGPPPPPAGSTWVGGPGQQPPPVGAAMPPGAAGTPPTPTGPPKPPTPVEAGPGASTTPPTGAGTPAAGSTSSSSQRNQLARGAADEPLGENSTIAMILFANKNHPNLKTDYPQWPDRFKQINKIWKTLPNDQRSQYVTMARENRTANRMNKQVRKPILHDFVFSFSSISRTQLMPGCG